MANIPSIPAEDLPPLSFMDRELSANLNATIFFVFLMAIYVVVYSGTLYIYLTLKASQSRFVIIMITFLFMLGMFQLGTQWGLLKWQFINSGQTKETVFLSSSFIPTWIPVADAITVYGSYILADMLLIWRCFNVWNRSPLAIMVPGGFIVIELATTSILSTFLIAHRIRMVRRLQAGGNKSLDGITDIVIQSGAVYSVALLMSGVIAVLPSNGPFGSIEMAEASQYIDTILTAASGIAPTLMVARVAMIDKGQNEMLTTHHISGLQFRHSRASKSNASHDAYDDEVMAVHSPDKEGQSLETDTL